MGEAFLRLSTFRVRSDGGGLFVRTGMEVTPQGICLGFFFFWFSICSNLISNIITFHLIIDLNELYFYLSRSLAGAERSSCGS